MKNSFNFISEHFEGDAEERMARFRQAIIDEKKKEQPDKGFIVQCIRQIQRIEGNRELPDGCQKYPGFRNRLSPPISEDDYSENSNP